MSIIKIISIIKNLPKPQHEVNLGFAKTNIPELIFNQPGSSSY